MLLAALSAILIMTIVWAITVWTSSNDVPMSKHGWIALGLGTVFSLVIGCGLMALMFFSSAAVMTRRRLQSSCSAARKTNKVMACDGTVRPLRQLPLGLREPHRQAVARCACLWLRGRGSALSDLQPQRRGNGAGYAGRLPG